MGGSEKMSSEIFTASTQAGHTTIFRNSHFSRFCPGAEKELRKMDSDKKNKLRKKWVLTKNGFWKMDSEKMDSEEMDSEKMDSEKMDSEKMDFEEMGSEELGSEAKQT